MITIRITNAEEVVRQQKGWFVSTFGGLFVDLDAKVEDVVAQQVRASLAASGVEAVVDRVSLP